MYIATPGIADLDASPATKPATAKQRRNGLLLCLAVILVTAALFPLAGVRWPAFLAFIPAYQTAVIVFYGIAAYLIFSHFLGCRHVALLHLGCGCLYTAGILIAQFMSFPGMFAAEGVLPGGAQTTIWLWAMWHIGPAVGMLLYAADEGFVPATSPTIPDRCWRMPFSWCFAGLS